MILRPASPSLLCGIVCRLSICLPLPALPDALPTPLVPCTAPPSCVVVMFPIPLCSACRILTSSSGRITRGDDDSTWTDVMLSGR